MAQRIRVASSDTARIIGKQGATIQTLNQTFGVEIQVPSKHVAAQHTEVEVTVHPMGSHSNVAGAVARIREILAGVAGGSSSSSMMTGASRAPGKPIALFIFRQNTDNNRLELLLQSKTTEWNVPGDRISDEDAGLAASDLILRALIRNCGEAPYDQGTIDIMDVKFKLFAHICLPPHWQAWGPCPTEVPDNILLKRLIAFDLIQARLSNKLWGVALVTYVWVDVEALQASGSALTAGMLNKQIPEWFTRNSNKLAEIYSNYGLEGAVSSASTTSGGDDSFPEDWAHTPDGVRLLENFQQMLQTLTQLSPDQLLYSVGAVFNPHHLVAASQRWGQHLAEHVGPLPHPM